MEVTTQMLKREEGKEAAVAAPQYLFRDRRYGQVTSSMVIVFEKIIELQERVEMSGSCFPVETYVSGANRGVDNVGIPSVRSLMSKHARNFG